MYHAFLSYSHRADARVAPVLQRALERLGTPWWRRSPVRVFRDDSSLPASAALWPAIEAALHRSEHFVLLASPEAAASSWVDQELRWWLANRSHRRLILVVTRGEIAYDGAHRDFDRTRTDCLPPALQGVFDVEPHWTDLRAAASQPRRLSWRQRDFRNAALGVAAAIRGLRKDELESIDATAHRRSVAAGIAGVSAVGVLAVATAVSVNIARSEFASARTSRLQAESRRLAAEAMTHLDGGRGIEAATIKAAIAWRLSPTDEARRALTRIDQTTSDVARVLARHTGQLVKLAFSRDGARLATIGTDGVVLQWTLADGRAVGVPLATQPQWAQQFRFSRDGTHLLVLGERMDTRATTLDVFRMADAARLPVGDAWPAMLAAAAHPSPAPCGALSPSGARVAVSSGDALVAIDTRTGAATLRRLPKNLRLAALAFADETHLVFVAENVYGERVRAGRMELADARVTLGPPIAFDTNRCDYASFSDDASRVALWGGSSSGLALWQIDERLVLQALPLPAKGLMLAELTGHHAPELDATGRRLAYGNDGTGFAWEPQTRRMLKTTPHVGDGHGPPFAISADGRFVAALDSSTPIVWKLDGGDASPRTIEGTRCGGGGLEDACIQRLCERITVKRDDAQWRELLGDGYPAIVEALQGTACAAAGGPRLFVGR